MKKRISAERQSSTHRRKIKSGPPTVAEPDVPTTTLLPALPGDEPALPGFPFVPALDEPPVELAAPLPLLSAPAESLLHALTHTSRHVAAALPSTRGNERD